MEEINPLRNFPSAHTPAPLSAILAKQLHEPAQSARTLSMSEEQNPYEAPRETDQAHRPWDAGRIMVVALGLVIGSSGVVAKNLYGLLFCAIFGFSMAMFAIVFWQFPKDTR
jgi:hypothetical protein